ncbi:MAG TPA: FAD-dependent thymidylate synthase, partial [Nitrospira sp.]|nr:FAD-dependent thymidylate synthase [Nitrospira sp.]
RIASFTQESTRFVNYAKKMPPSFIYPKDGEPDPDWTAAIEQCEASYRALLDKGWRPQEARSVFPNALSSKIVVTFNLRTWRHFFLMRTTKEAHPQMRQVTIPLLAEFQRLVPVLYEDIVPESRQVESIAKGR